MSHLHLIDILLQYMLKKHARQLKYYDDDDDDDDGDNNDDDDNNNNNNNRLHFTSYLGTMFCVGLPLYKSSLVLSHTVCYGVKDPYKYKKSSSLTFNHNAYSTYRNNEQKCLPWR